MNRDDILLVGCGGAGDKVVDSIMNLDSAYQGFFINSSKTDIEALNNYDEDYKNYICVSTKNGTGRNRNLGKIYTNKKKKSILESIQNSDQNTVFLFSSFSGGSGSSAISVITEAIDQIKADEYEFDKIINIVAILPKTNEKSPDIFLENTIDTWNEIMQRDCINSMIFIDNNTMSGNSHMEESDMNNEFAELWDNIFDIPNVNGTNFDNGNLGNIINAKGCIYIYKLPNKIEDIDQAMMIAEQNTVLAKIFKSEDNIIKDKDGNEKVKCKYLGSSFNDENYSILHELLLDKYHIEGGEDYRGYNENNNIVIISGCLPPFDNIKAIMDELSYRKTKNSKMQKNNLDTFIVNNPKEDNNRIIEKKNSNLNTNNIKEQNPSQKRKGMPKTMKKTLFGL